MLDLDIQTFESLSGFSGNFQTTNYTLIIVNLNYSVYQLPTI